MNKIEFLEKLKAKGVKIGIATATGESALIAVMEKFNMLHYFSPIYSTYTVGASKKEPRVYDVVLEELGTDKKTTWVFEDALYAAKTAKANGYNVVGIYDRSEPLQDELKNLVAPEAYCRTLLRNICIDRWRQLRAHDDDEEIEADGILLYTPPETDKKEAEECLQHFLAALPGVQQKIIGMMMNGCTFEEIEKVTGLRQTNIRVIISRVRKRFREFYDNI